MISDKATKYAKRVGQYMRSEFGARYTINVTHWNDGDFRVVGYTVLRTDTDALPGDAEKYYDEVWYHDSKMPDGVAMRGRTAQDSAKPRSQTEQYDVGDPEQIDLPRLADDTRDRSIPIPSRQSNFELGAQYRLTQEERNHAQLSSPRQRPPTTEHLQEEDGELLTEFDSVSLNEGDVITYVGRIGPFGHDKIWKDCFEYEGKIGVFHPNEWGIADKAWLERV